MMSQPHFVKVQQGATSTSIPMPTTVWCIWYSSLFFFSFVFCFFFFIMCKHCQRVDSSRCVADVCKTQIRLAASNRTTNALISDTLKHRVYVLLTVDACGHMLGCCITHVNRVLGFYSSGRQVQAPVWSCLQQPQPNHQQHWLGGQRVAAPSDHSNCVHQGAGYTTQ